MILLTIVLKTLVQESWANIATIFNSPSILTSPGELNAELCFWKLYSLDQVEKCFTHSIVLLQWYKINPAETSDASKLLSNCQLWRSRPVNNLLSDLYDGQIWKEFLNIGGSPFLAAPYTFGLMLNIDWFQPYIHTISSVGVIYLTIMNLPRTIRFKLENIIIVGIIIWLYHCP